MELSASLAAASIPCKYNWISWQKLITNSFERIVSWNQSVWPLSDWLWECVCDVRMCMKWLSISDVMRLFANFYSRTPLVVRIWHTHASSHLIRSDVVYLRSALRNLELDNSTERISTNWKSKPNQTGVCVQFVCVDKYGDDFRTNCGSRYTHNRTTHSSQTPERKCIFKLMDVEYALHSHTGAQATCDNNYSRCSCCAGCTQHLSQLPLTSSQCVAVVVAIQRPHTLAVATT